MEVRKYMPEDYETIAPWFVEHGWPSPPDASILSTTGLIVEDETGPRACGFLYLTNSQMAFLEWVVTRPAQGVYALRALRVLFKKVHKECKALGIARVLTFSDDKTMKIFEDIGDFKPTEKATLMIWGGE